MKSIVLYNEILPDASEDDRDVLVQRDMVVKTLNDMGYKTELLPVTLDLKRIHDKLSGLKPVFVFNLVESITAVGRFIYFVPTILEHLQIPFTGSSSDTLYLTTNKVLCKERLKEAGLKTPAWSNSYGVAPNTGPPYIIKPVWEDASVGLDDKAMVYDTKSLNSIFKKQTLQFGSCFSETYIDGREFNLSLLDSENGPQLLPAAEIRFEEYPDDKPRIVGYKAKWESNSFEYTHTPRHFNFPDSDNDLLQKLKHNAIECWHLFKLSGYARVDFRVDYKGTIWILEVNANPCISPDSGFIAAARQAGVTFEDVIKCIVSAALRKAL